MTVSQAANKIGISASKLYQLASARRIAHYRVGGKIIFDDDDVAAFLASCRIRAATPTPPSIRTQPRLKHIDLG